MYQVSHFDEPDLRINHQLIGANPLGLMVSHTEESGLNADPLPFVLDPQRGAHGILLAHLARPNPQAEALHCADECLVVFQGPQGYVTPSWYPSKQTTGKVVPTWNYATVHVWGIPTVINDETWLRDQLELLTHQHEHSQEYPWSTADAPAAFISTMVKGIIGIEIEITRIQGKWKVSQNRSAADIAGVHQGLLADGQSELAALVAERGRLESS